MLKRGEKKIEDRERDTAEFSYYPQSENIFRDKAGVTGEGRAGLFSAAMSKRRAEGPR